MSDARTRPAAKAALACLASLSIACASLTAVDIPLARWTPEDRGMAGRQVAGDRSGEVLVFVAFSGGGTRAAAFAYGVLQELRDSEIATEQGRRPLLHEVDVISSVSGGSFTSAYYALRGDRIFEEFEERFLRKNVEGALLGRVFRPLNWLRMLSATYTRSELAANYYDAQLFGGATFEDLRRPDAPLVVINSTDLASGQRFAFLSTDFGAICADIKQYPISRAVAASSAVPVLLSPVTLESFAGTCGYESPAWAAEALADETLTTRKLLARSLHGYTDRHARPFLHLVDGGIADNLGLRSIYEAVLLRGDDPRAAFRAFDHPDVRHVVIISVNAHAQEKKGWALERDVPSLAQVLQSVSADQIERYSVDTIELVHDSFDRWTREASTAERPLSFDFVEVSFEAVRDSKQRDFLNGIGTNFHLNDDEVDALIRSGSDVLRASKPFQVFLERVDGKSLAPHPAP
jgi:NTE family protein